eukprot:2128795-Amphidinium_carterae.1
MTLALQWVALPPLARLLPRECAPCLLVEICQPGVHAVTPGDCSGAAARPGDCSSGCSGSVWALLQPELASLLIALCWFELGMSWMLQLVVVHWIELGMSWMLQLEHVVFAPSVSFQTYGDGVFRPPTLATCHG